jgi:hypothetical protein
MGLNRNLGNLTEVIKKGASSNVGIGKFSPNARLDVNGNAIVTGSLTVTQPITGSLFGTASFATTASFTNVAGLGGFVQGGNSFGTQALIGTNDNQSLALETSGSIRMFISSSGNIGIGTTNPGTSRLAVFGTISSLSDFGSGLQLLSATDPNRGLYMGYNHSGNYSLIESIQQGVAYRNLIINPNAGNVGIGTTNPESTLVIQKNTSGGRGGELSIVNYALASIGAESALNFGLEASTYGGNDCNFQIKGLLNNINGATDAVFSNWSGAAFLERMRINSNGHITTPNQPSFLAYSNNSGFSVTAGTWINVSTSLTVELYDISSNYSSGRFTAPVAGRYFFYAGGWSSILSNGERYAFSAIVNGGPLTFIGGGNYCLTDSPLSGYSIVYSLAAGDFVDLQVFSAVGGTWGAGTHRVFWGGYLL